MRLFGGSPTLHPSTASHGIAQLRVVGVELQIGIGIEDSNLFVTGLPLF